MRIWLGALAAWALMGTFALAADQPSDQKLTPEQVQADTAHKIAAAIKPRYGDVRIAEAGVTLHLGHDYYFVDPDVARGVIVSIWGNMPNAADGVLGMIVPAGKTVESDTWAAVLSYEDSGYVSDSDAASTDYGEVLKQAREHSESENAERKMKGYPPVHLVGWAQPPYYDKAHHTLVWARAFKFEGTREDSLNYDLRALGRKGVLSMNIVAGMSQLKQVREAAAKLQNIGTYDGGQRYQDYKEGTDKVAEYGVGGLVAAGVGVVLAKKIGLIGAVLLFAKKFFAVILAGFAGIGAWLKRTFGRSKAV